MSKVKVGDRVIVIDNNELKKATVKNIYVNVAIIEYDDGYLDKKRIDDLAPEPVQEIPEEKPTEPVEKSEVTITRDEYRKIGIDVLTKLSKDEPMMGLLGIAVIGEIERKLFVRPVGND